MRVCECCHQIIDDSADREIKKIQEIIVEASTELNVYFTDVIGIKRIRKLCEARYMIWDLLYSERRIKYTYSDIGKYFSNKDHSTLIHGVTKCKLYCEVYPEFKEKYMALHQKIYGHLRYFKYL